MITFRWYSPIAHVDADCFFASCEIVRNPKLKGKKMAVVSNVGGCIVAKTYEAKAAGIKTGMPPWEARNLCPNLITIKVDFDYYAKLSKQMFRVLREFSPDVEKRSIDEGYIDLKGLRGLYHKTFEEIGKDIQEKVLLSTGLPVSVGIANTKIVAKIASEVNKPMGVKIVSGRDVEDFIKTIPLVDIPGIGPNKAAMLEKFGLKNAGDLALLDYSTAKSLLDKQGVAIWHELNGKQIWKLEKEKKPQQSISKTASFGFKVTDRDYLFGELLNNLERAISKLVSSNQKTKTLNIFLRKQEYKSTYASVDFPNHTDNFNELADKLKPLFESIWERGKVYRSTGVIFTNLILSKDQNLSLFENEAINDNASRFEHVREELNRKYGKGTLSVASKILSSKFRTKPKRCANSQKKYTRRMKYVWLGESV